MTVPPPERSSDDQPLTRRVLRQRATAGQPVEPPAAATVFPSSTPTDPSAGQPVEPPASVFPSTGTTFPPVYQLDESSPWVIRAAQPGQFAPPAALPSTEASPPWASQSSRFAPANADPIPAATPPVQPAGDSQVWSPTGFGGTSATATTPTSTGLTGQPQVADPMLPPVEPPALHPDWRPVGAGLPGNSGRPSLSGPSVPTGAPALSAGPSGGAALSGPGGPAGMVPPTRADGIVPPTVTPDGHPVSRRERQERRRRHAGAIILGVFGEILITLGVILGLYVAWELVWTDVEANQEAIQVIQTVVDRPAWIHPDKNSPNAPHHDPADDPPPVDDNPLITPPLGETWAVLHVPRWGSDYVVPMVEGIDRPTILNKGLIGHYPGTAGPGRIGNFATAAHRTTYGKPYNRVAELENGDPLIVETDNYYFVYEVYGYEIVYPHEVRVIWPVPNEENAVPTKRIITLTTCHPMFSARQRYIVWGEMTYWVDKSEGQLDVLAEEG